MSTGKTGKHHHFAHHFESAEHEYTTTKQGVWLFMVTEILMFGALFVAYAIYKSKYPEVFIEGAKFVDWRMGATNTVVLIFSSLTMALGIHFFQKNKPVMANSCLFVTLLCGATFMVIKYFEYEHKIHLGLTPPKFFHYNGHMVEYGKLYFGFYYTMTGLHGIHVLVGMGLITWVMIRGMKGEFGPDYYTPVEGVGLFWHIVDLIWIYLFPLYYLV